MSKISPSLGFDTEAEAAANFYVSIFKNSKIGTISRYGDAGPGPGLPKRRDLSRRMVPS